MNAKKKNKKAHKPPNPNPPQNVESEAKIEEKLEELQPKCEVKQDIMPVKVPSEVLVAPISEVKEIESETPKKPKRNKGKNKKNDEENKIEVLQKPQEITEEVRPNIEEPQRLPHKILEDKEDPLGDASVVPSARKKKNKKKGHDKVPEEPKPSDDDKIIPTSQFIENVEKIEPETHEQFVSIPEMPKEGKKKKNKKKNRNDSERSDKSDNILSCTSAFQKILAEDESSKQVTPETKLENIELEPHIQKEHADVETLPLSQESKSELEKTQELIEEPKELKEETKSKKKNKKDKKQNQKDIETSKKEVPEEFSANIEVITENVIPDALTQELKSEEVLTESQKEDHSSPKTKAKIAKPVEKKRKGKTDTQPLENITDVESSEIKKSDCKNVVESTAQPLAETKYVENPEVNITESKVDDKQLEKPVSSSPMENITIPSDQAMGKKRKKSKSPKPQKHKDISQNTEKSNVESETIVSEKKYTITQSEVILGQPVIALSEPKDSTGTLSDTLSPQVQMHVTKQTSDSFEPTVIAPTPTSPMTSENKQDNEGFEVKTGKKKKKIPKTPIAETSSCAEKTEDNKLKKTFDDKFDVTLESLLMPDPNVLSVRTESEASSCDLVPEVHFVRSASQQLLDTNNNTVIQEVTNVDDIKLSDLHETPLVQGSGETPIATPELISSGIKLMDVETKASTDEKTDIKSKMMEVNKDMEDLRLSIERSLAEFAALDKCEADLENKPEKKSLQKEVSPAMEKEKSSHVEEKPIPTTQEIPLAVEKKEPEKLVQSPDTITELIETIPVCPARKDNKGKGKSNKKGKQDNIPIASVVCASSNVSTTSQPKDNTKEEKKEKSEQKSEQKSDSSQGKGKQQSSSANDNKDMVTSNDENYPINSENIPDTTEQTDFEPIENFEDALTSSIDDVNKTFEMIVKDADDDNIELQKKLAANKPEISITEPSEDRDKDSNRNEKVNPVSQPKNLLGHTNIPVQSNRTDYKKEKNKTPNARQARVKIRDSSEIEPKKQSKESQTSNKRTRKNSDQTVKESFSRVKNENEEYVYKYSFRKVFLQSACHVCNKELVQVRVPCGYCNLIFYCGAKHKDDDWPQHQALCFAVSTLAHMKDQKHIYADAQNTTGQDYRLLRMQMIVSSEKVLKRRLVPWEQEIMLYPRMCADVACKEWRQNKLKDCDGCGQISYCATNPDHLPKAHARWCKSYSLYQRLVGYQQTKGRLEPTLPTKVLTDDLMPAKMNEVLASMYEEKIDMNDIQYASLTQLATAPLTTAYCLQLCRSASGIANGIHKKHPFTIHVVGAELQFEADALNKWETFFLHVRPDVEELRVVMISPALNPGQLPLHLLGKIKLCENCQHNKRRVVFKFEDNKNYSEYRNCEDFINPDIICAFNPSIQRSSIYNGKDPWPASVNSILKLKTPFVVTAYTLNELRKDIARIKQVSELDFKFISEPGFNSFASVRPDRNFISDDEMPLLFKNYCVSVIVGC